MSRSPFPEPNAVLFQLLAELDGYASEVEGLVQEWQVRRTVVVFGEAGQAMSRMRRLAVRMPQLSAQWLMVMISHTELMHNLWRATRGEPVDVASEVHVHLAAVGSLAASCRRLLVEAGQPVH